jgi:hypothetical protein
VPASRSFSCADCASDGSLLCAIETAVLLDAIANYRGEESRSGYVHVAKVCTVGLVEIVVGFEERGAGRGDHGLEERMRRDRGGLEVQLCHEGTQESELLSVISSWLFLEYWVMVKE